MKRSFQLAGSALAVTLWLLACVGDDPAPAGPAPSTEAGADTRADTSAETGPDATPDSGNDAADTSTVDANTCVPIPADPGPGGICPTGPCNAGESCCFRVAGAEAWICTNDPNNECVINTSIRCNSRADCGAQRCCLKGTLTKECPALIVDSVRSTICRDACGAGETEVCTGGAACATGSCAPALLPFPTMSVLENLVIGLCL